MNIMQKILPIVTLVASLNANAVLGPIPIYLNTEYRTDSPVISSIASTLSFNADDIKATGANTFLDFLATVPSVGLHYATGNVPALFMRGGNSNHTLVLVDGVRANGPESQNGAIENGLANIPLNNIEKIEVIKGSGSVLYGSSATAGVIAITTKKGANGEKVVVSTKFGTHNSKTYALSASSGDENSFVRFTHNKYTTDGIDAHDSDASNDKDSIGNRATQIKFGNQYFDVGYLESKDKTEYDRCWNGTSTVDECLGNRKLNKIVVNANKKINNTWNTKLSFAQTKSNRDTQHGTTFTNGDKYKSTSITVLNDIKIDNALLNVGFAQIDDKNTTDNQKLSSKDLFLNWQKNINDIDINTGIRYIKHSKFKNKTIYNLGIAKYLDNGIKLTSTYSAALNTPVLAQLSGTGSNPNLEPEDSKNIELGIQKQYDWGTIDTRLYENKIKNAFRSDATTGFNWTNIGKLVTKGVEFSINTTVENYNIDFNHSYNNSKANDETTQSIRRPKNTTNLTIIKQYGKINSRIQVIKKSSSIDGNTEFKGYTLVNLSNDYNINKQAKLSLNIKNITDKNYTTVRDFNGTYNHLGRTIEVGLDYQF